MSQTKAGRPKASNPAPKPVKTTAKAEKVTAKPSSKPSERSNAAQSSKPSSGIKPIKTGQRRELWVLSCLFMTLLLSLAAFGKGGIIPQALHRFMLGILGWGAYVAPFAALADMLFIIYARGKPVKKQLFACSLMPFLFSASIHILTSQISYSPEHYGLLYQNGILLLSGGFLGGGFGELSVKLLSRVGAILVMLGLLATDVLMLFDTRLIDLLDTVIDLFEMHRISRRYYPEDEETPDNSFEEDDENAHSDDNSSARSKQEAVKRPGGRSSVPESPPSDPSSSAHEIPIKAEPSRSSRSIPDIVLDAVAPEAKNALPDTWPSGKLEKRGSADNAAADAPNEVLSPEKSIHHSKVPSAPTPYALKHWAKGSAAQAVSDNDDVPPWEEPKTSSKSRRIYDIPLSPQEPAADTVAPPSVKNASPAADENAPSTAASSMVSEDLQVVDTHMQKRPAENKAAEDDLQNAIDYHKPPVDLLNEPVNAPAEDISIELRERSQSLADALVSFGVSAKIIGAIRGPSVTRYELQLDPGVKLSRLTSLQNDIALALGAVGVRIAPIPDKQAVGIEVPNKVVQTVYLREVLLSQNMSREKSKLAFALGRDITGNSIIANIHKMPHLLIAGTTGSGKSVCINSIIVSLLYRTSPRDVRFIMIDPKMVELGNYNGIPHLLIPVVTDYKKAPGTLAWAVAEMERRYKLMAEAGARELNAYNEMLALNKEEPLPKIVIIIDELADLMMVAAKDIEEAICRIAQKARAAGMHLIIATQRPSADVLTGLMKSNIPSRIAFAVASQTESRIILDQGGADKLIGRGDMLFLPIGEGKPLRVQGCFLSDGEIERITDYIKKYNHAEYSAEIIDQIENANRNQGTEAPDDDEADPLIGDAIDIFMETGQASASMLQRRMKVGYARAARIVDQAEARGIIGPADGSHSRPILISKMDWEEMKLRYGVRS